MDLINLWMDQTIDGGSKDKSLKRDERQMKRLSDLSRRLKKIVRIAIMKQMKKLSVFRVLEHVDLEFVY